MAAEAELERKCVKYAKSLGWIMPKWTSPGTSGVHDRLLITAGPTGFVIDGQERARIIPIEFKAPGKKLTAKQRVFHRKLSSMGIEHGVIDNFDNFVELCRRLGA